MENWKDYRSKVQIIQDGMDCVILKQAISVNELDTTYFDEIKVWHCERDYYTGAWLKLFYNNLSSISFQTPFHRVFMNRHKDGIGNEGRQPFWIIEITTWNDITTRIFIDDAQNEDIYNALLDIKMFHEYKDK